MLLTLAATTILTTPGVHRLAAAPPPASRRTTIPPAWVRVAACESGGRWHLNTGNGYYGGLQFTLPTWRGFGGVGRPDEATPAEQVRVAERVLAVQGWGAWPVCGGDG